MVVEIFKQFEAFNFSNGFAVMRGDEDYHLEVWSRNLDGLTQREIENGLRESAKLNWAPSVGAFKNLCRPRIINSQAYENGPYKTLSNYNPDSIIGKLEMSKIRKILGMPQVDRDEKGNIIIDGEKNR